MEQQRFAEIDALRGLIMMLMAIDHASAFIARQHASEFWAGAMSAYDSAFPFLTRWVTHLCAPGFFFLMGAGIVWMSASRERAGWTGTDAMRRVALRGGVLVLLAQLLETPVMYLQNLMKPAAASLNRITAPPPNDGSTVVWGLITLTGLGLVMLACALLLPLPRWTWLAASAASVWATNSLLPADGKPGPLWQAVLLAPGLSQHVIVVYPVIPWLAGAAAGMLFARWWRGGASQAAALGGVLLAAGIGLRTAGGWGNIRLPRDASWIEFLNNVKYPPSLVFWCMALGIDLLLLALLARAPERWKSAGSPLVVFGQTPLFFYLVHFYLLALLGIFAFREAASLEAAYLVWAAVLAVLYPVCAWYRRFKLSKPIGSLWRMF